MAEKICPNCRKPIYEDEALFCHFCGESLQRSGQGLFGQLKYGRWRLVMAGFVIFIIVLFILFLAK